VPLRSGDILYPGGHSIRHVYFPRHGFISIAAMVGRRPSLELGMVGCEGMLGTPIVLGVSFAPYRAVVEGDGMAWRADLKAFLSELRRRPGLKRAMQRYLYVTSVQLAASAACCGLHPLGQRLARRLLTTLDRARVNTFEATHEHLAYHLGVRRGCISAAAAALKERGLIQYRRGTVTVIDRHGLEAAACRCYRAERQTYATFFH
jgi:CRP-like cAMP-binding protein